MEDDKLIKDCPCCVGRGKLISREPDRAFPHKVECNICGLQTEWCGLKTEAVMKWNARKDKGFSR